VPSNKKWTLTKPSITELRSVTPGLGRQSGGRVAIPAIDPEAYRWLQAGAWLATAIGATVAAVKLWSELRLGREQRARDLRWKQAEAAKALHDQMLDDPESRLALQMLDYTGRSFEFPTEREWVVTEADLMQALNPATDGTSTGDVKVTDIRYCFDGLFYYLAALHHNIASTLILTEDVAFPLDYYVPLLAEYRPELEAYFAAYRLHQTKAFLQRYEAWNAAPAKRPLEHGAAQQGS
jgi:hypothetical protein